MVSGLLLVHLAQAMAGHEAADHHDEQQHTVSAIAAATAAIGETVDCIVVVGCGSGMCVKRVSSAPDEVHQHGQREE